MSGLSEVEVSAAIQLFRKELHQNMHNSSGSPGHDAMRVTLQAFLRGRKKLIPRIYARDLDGTGSLHPCAKGDPGAIALYDHPEEK